MLLNAALFTCSMVDPFLALPAKQPGLHALQHDTHSPALHFVYIQTVSA
jgi:hypothetical protein